MPSSGGGGGSGSIVIGVAGGRHAPRRSAIASDWPSDVVADRAGLGRALLDPQTDRLEVVRAERRQAARHRAAGDGHASRARSTRAASSTGSSRRAHPAGCGAGRCRGIDGDQARVRRVRSQVEAAGARAAVADVLRAALALEDHRLDRREGGVERVGAARMADPGPLPGAGSGEPAPPEPPLQAAAMSEIAAALSTIRKAEFLSRVMEPPLPRVPLPTVTIPLKEPEQGKSATQDQHRLALTDHAEGASS